MLEDLHALQYETLSLAAWHTRQKALPRPEATHASHQACEVHYDGAVFPVKTLSSGPFPSSSGRSAAIRSAVM